MIPLPPPAFIIVKFPDPKALQISITGFLETKAPEFTKELWILLLSAQENIAGMPQRFIDEKKEEIRKRKVGSPGR